MVKKKQSRKQRVSFTVRDDALNQLEEILKGGLHGRSLSKAAERLLMENLSVRRGDDKADYKMVVELEGYSAFAVLNYIAKTEGDPRQVFDYIVTDWVGRNWKMLSDARVNFDNPDWKKYLKIKK